jgi:hypothetical protein
VRTTSGIDDRRGPVEAVVERVAYEGAQCRVVAAHACVDVSNEFPVVGNGNFFIFLTLFNLKF